MSVFDVRFIREPEDTAEKHLVVEVEASNHDEALEKGRDALKDKEWLALYDFWSVEIKRY